MNVIISATSMPSDFLAKKITQNFLVLRALESKLENDALASPIVQISQDKKKVKMYYKPNLWLFSGPF